MQLHIENLARNIAESHGLRESVIDIKPGSKKGDGYVGDIHMVSASGLHNKKLNLIVKSATADELVVKKYRIREVFENEEQFYRNIFPKLKQFQDEKHIPRPFAAIAKYYGSHFEGTIRLIALENLKIGGFELFDKKATVDGDHVEKVFAEYGRFHGVGFAYQNEHKETFDEITGALHDCWSIFLQDEMFPEMLMSICKDVTALLEEGKDARLQEEFKRYENPASVFENVVSYTGKYPTLTHGDCWTNNLMFKYKVNKNGEKQLDSIRLLDWQLTRIGTPVYDLSYFLYSSSSKPIFDNLDHYLDVYYKSLSKTLRDLGHDPDHLYPFHVLKSDWKEYSTFGFLLGLMLLRIKLTYDDSIVDLHDIKDIENQGDAADKFVNAKYDVDVFNQRVIELMRHRSELGLL